MARDVVVIGGSAGALEPLRAMFGALPQRTAAAFFVAIHTSPDTPGLLPTLLDNCSAMPVAYAVDGDAILSGRVLIAPPDHHLLLQGDRVSVTRGPRENGFRPAVDPLFRTAAAAFHGRVIGIVLSGGLDDGTRGLLAVKRAGGLAIVQKVDDSFASGMPLSAMRNVDVDYVAPASGLADLVRRLVDEPRTTEDDTMPSEKAEPDRAERGLHALQDETFKGPPSTFTCPECGGTLWEVTNGNLERFACHVGHSYTPETLATNMAATLEAALWTALRALEENAEFLRRMHDRAAGQGLDTIADGYRAKASDAEARAEVIRAALVENAPAVAMPPRAPSSATD